jgi:hypothetical protein
MDRIDEVASKWVVYLATSEAIYMVYMYAPTITQ